MANLYGRMKGKSGEVTRTGTRSMTAKLETWTGSVKVEMDKEGNYTVYAGDKHNPKEVIAKGQV